MYTNQTEVEVLEFIKSLGGVESLIEFLRERGEFDLAQEFIKAAETVKEN